MDCVSVTKNVTKITVSSLSVISRNESLIMSLIIITFVSALALGFNMIRKNVYEDKVRNISIRWGSETYANVTVSLTLVSNKLDRRHFLNVILMGLKN